jgi:hypothetical protein
LENVYNAWSSDLKEDRSSGEEFGLLFGASSRERDYQSQEAIGRQLEAAGQRLRECVELHRTDTQATGGPTDVQVESVVDDLGHVIMPLDDDPPSSAMTSPLIQTSAADTVLAAAAMPEPATLSIDCDELKQTYESLNADLTAAENAIKAVAGTASKDSTFVNSSQLDDLRQRVSAAKASWEHCVAQATPTKKPTAKQIGILVGVVVIVAVIAVAVALSGGSPKSTSPTSTTVPPAAAVGSGERTVQLGGNFGPISKPPYGDDPLMVTLTALPGAPSSQSVVMDFTGPGLPASYTFTVGAPGSVASHTFILNTCGAWSERIASDDGQVFSTTSQFTDLGHFSVSCSSG